LILDAKLSPKWGNDRQNGASVQETLGKMVPPAHPKALRKRIRDATSIFHRFGIAFGSHFAIILMVLVTQIDQSARFLV